MEVEHQAAKGPHRKAELFCAGSCLAVQIGTKIHRFALTSEQWELLRQSAASRAPIPFRESPFFVHIGKSVMRGAQCVAVACSKTMAKRIANALNRHQPNKEGV